MIILPVYHFNKSPTLFRIWYMDTIYFPKYDWKLRIHKLNQTSMATEHFKEVCKGYGRTYKSN